MSEEAHASIHYDLTVSNKMSSSRVFSCKIITDEKGYVCAALIVALPLQNMTTTSIASDQNGLRIGFLIEINTVVTRISIEN